MSDGTENQELASESTADLYKMNRLERAAAKWIVRNTKEDLRYFSHIVLRHYGSIAASAVAALGLLWGVSTYPSWSGDPKDEAAALNKAEETRLNEVMDSFRQQQKLYGITIQDVFGEDTFDKDSTSPYSFMASTQSAKILENVKTGPKGEVLCIGPDLGGWNEPVECKDLVAARKEVDRLGGLYQIMPSEIQSRPRPIGIFNGLATCTHYIGEPAVVCADVIVREVEERSRETCLNKIDASYRWDAHYDDGSVSADRDGPGSIVLSYSSDGKAVSHHYRENASTLTGAAPYAVQVQACMRAQPLDPLRRIVLPDTPPDFLRHLRND